MNWRRTISVLAVGAALGFPAGDAAASGTGTSLLGGMFQGWFLSERPERDLRTASAGVAHNSGVSVLGVKCNYTYAIRGGEKVRTEVCETTR